MKNCVEFGVNRRLKQVRLAFGLSQQAFAEMFNIPQTTYSKYEQTAHVPDYLKMDLARMGINLNWLIADIGEYIIRDSDKKKNKNIEPLGENAETAPVEDDAEKALTGRLKLLRENLGLSQKEFGEMLGLAQTSYSNYEGGKSAVPSDVLEVLYKKVGVSIDWLVAGDGQMYRNDAIRSENINDRLRKVRENTGLSQYKFAEVFNLPQSTYAQYEKGGRSVPNDLIARLQVQYNLNLNWFFSGEGEMYLK